MSVKPCRGQSVVTLAGQILTVNYKDQYVFILSMTSLYFNELFLNTQVKESLVLEQSRTKTLDRSLAQLSTSFNLLTTEVSVLKGSNRMLTENMQRWSGSFKSLLKDVIRHNDVLGLLLGEEVLEFLEWPIQDQRLHSILAMKEQLGLLQEQLRGHNLSISSLLALRSGQFSNMSQTTHPPTHPKIPPSSTHHLSNHPSIRPTYRDKQPFTHSFTAAVICGIQTMANAAVAAG